MPIVVNGILYGDGVGNLKAHQHANSQTLDASLFDTVKTIGDVDALLDHSTGGYDFINVRYMAPRTSLQTSLAIGDAFKIEDHAEGGNDTIKTGGYFSIAYGDAQILTGHGRGGSDVLTDSSYMANVFGDAERMDGHTWGGGQRHHYC
jgi:hypothetical protein